MTTRILADIFALASLPPKELPPSGVDDVLDVAFGVAMQHAPAADDVANRPTPERPLKAMFLSDEATESIILQDTRVPDAEPPWRGSGIDRADDGAVCVAEHAQFFASTLRTTRDGLQPRVGAMALFSFLVRPNETEFACKHRMVCIEDAATCDLWRSYASSWCQAAASDLKPIVDRIRARQQ
jgi:hypothetical protein